MLAAISRACSVPAWASRHRFTTSCDDADAAESLDDIAENMEKEEEDKDKIKGAMNYSNLKNSLGGCGANTFDGFRVIVQKQVNLNTVVSHFYWVGSQQVGQLYQYRLILPFDDKMINVATDMDMNIEGEVSATLSENVSVSSTFGSGAQQGTKATVHCDIKDGTSATRLTYHNGDGGVAYAMSYVQAMTKALQLGGKGTYANGALRTSFAGLYDSEENTFGAAYGTTQYLFRAMYMRKVNPNRVNLSTEIMMDNEGNNTVAVGAEYQLKQSKISFSVDSTLVIKSTVESNLSPGVQFQLSAEMAQAKEHYRFGYGLIMG